MLRQKLVGNLRRGGWLDGNVGQVVDKALFSGQKETCWSGGRGGSYYLLRGWFLPRGTQRSILLPSPRDGPVPYVQIPSNGGPPGPPRGGIQYSNAGSQTGTPVSGSVFVPVANRAQGSQYGSQNSTLAGRTFGNYQGGESSHASRSTWHHALQRDVISGSPGLNYHMNYHNFEMGPGSALDTGQKPVANHASFASLTHQNIWSLEISTLNNILQADRHWARSSCRLCIFCRSCSPTGGGNGYSFNPGNRTLSLGVIFHTEALVVSNAIVENPRDLEGQLLLSL